MVDKAFTLLNHYEDSRPRQTMMIAGGRGGGGGGQQPGPGHGHRVRGAARPAQAAGHHLLLDPGQVISTHIYTYLQLSTHLLVGG